MPTSLFSLLIFLLYSLFYPAHFAMADESSSDESSSDASASSYHDYEPEIRRYTLYDPAWSFQPLVTLNGLGGTASTLPKISGIATKGYGFQTEFFFKFMHKIGALSAGAGLLLYQPTTLAGEAMGKTFGLWSFVGSVRYQLRYLREQPLVPFIGFEAEKLHYNFSSGPNNTVWMKGPVMGAMFLLNFLEPTAAADAFVTNGVLRSYIYAEFRTLTGSNGEATIGGRSLFFGFRFEGV